MMNDDVSMGEGTQRPAKMAGQRSTLHRLLNVGSPYHIPEGDNRPPCPQELSLSQMFDRFISEITHVKAVRQVVADEISASREEGGGGSMTAIEWTDATWNPVTGCTKVSAGCDNCYAERIANGITRHNYMKRLPVVTEHREDPFAVRLWPERVNQPAEWRKPRMVFVNSMSDLFHADIPVDFLDRIFRVMLATPRHTFQILTKRPGRARRYVDRITYDYGIDLLPPHIWVGTSVEDADVLYRASHLRLVRAQVRFLSIEPLIGPVSLVDDTDRRPILDDIDWVIVGGESGPRHRFMDIAWVRSIRDQCVAADVPFFFKQWGGRTPKAGGRVLDGREWNEMPRRPE